jgi:hypothetical protein
LVAGSRIGVRPGDVVIQPGTAPGEPPEQSLGSGAPRPTPPDLTKATFGSAGLFVPKPTSGLDCQARYGLGLRRAVRQPPRTSAAVTVDSYSSGYSLPLRVTSVGTWSHVLVSTSSEDRGRGTLNIQELRGPRHVHGRPSDRAMPSVRGLRLQRHVRQPFLAQS